MSPSVAVVIPTLNEERHIGRCLAALMALDYPRDSLRIRVVDNFSADRTVQIAKEYGVEVVQLPKSTIAASRNCGAQGAGEDIVAFLDADCVPAPSWLREGVKHFASVGVVAVGAYPGVLEDESNTLQKTWAEISRRAGNDVHAVSWLPSANLLVRGEVFSRIGGFNEAMATCEDVDLSYRLSEMGAVLYDPAVLVYHLREPSDFKELFRKEVWHAKSNFAGIASHGLRWRELPSLLAPLAFGAGAIAGAIGLGTGGGVLSYGFGLSALTVLAYAARACPRTARLDMAVAIYTVYFSARFYAAVREGTEVLGRWGGYRGG